MWRGGRQIIKRTAVTTAKVLSPHERHIDVCGCMCFLEKVGSWEGELEAG